MRGVVRTKNIETQKNSLSPRLPLRKQEPLSQHQGHGEPGEWHRMQGAIPPCKRQHIPAGGEGHAQQQDP